MADTILEVKNLKKYFKTNKGNVHAVDNVSFTLERGKTLGIVGESGCGKSTTGRTILRLIEPTSGEVYFDGKDICKVSNKEMTKLRKDMQIIFQDPFSSLDPRMTVSQLIAEPLKYHKIIEASGKELEQKTEEMVLDLMRTVGLAERLYNAYPHELDGGRRQRIGIARALILQPKLIVCDEPVSALDVSIQAQILNLLQELQKERGLTYIFITHNLSVVNHIADEIAVMYLGSIVEKAAVEDLFQNPLHPCLSSNRFSFRQRRRKVSFSSGQGAVAVRLRATRMRSHPCRRRPDWSRYTSRSRRRQRLRVTALPSFTEAVSPRRL